MRKLLATLALALVALTTVEAQQQRVIGGVSMNLYFTNTAMVYNKTTDKVTGYVYENTGFAVNSSRDLVEVRFDGDKTNILETVFVRDDLDYYVLKVSGMEEYVGDTYKGYKRVNFYIIFYKNENRVEQTKDTINYLINVGI